jgi:hypothetical protein
VHRSFAGKNPFLGRMRGKVKPPLGVDIGPQREKNRSFRFDAKKLPVFSIPPKLFPEIWSVKKSGL